MGADKEERRLWKRHKISHPLHPDFIYLGGSQSCHEPLHLRPTAFAAQSSQLPQPHGHIAIRQRPEVPEYLILPRYFRRHIQEKFFTTNRKLICRNAATDPDDLTRMIIAHRQGGGERFVVATHDWHESSAATKTCQILESNLISPFRSIVTLSGPVLAPQPELRPRQSRLRLIAHPCMECFGKP